MRDRQLHRRIPRDVRGYYCVVTDSGYGKSFSARGADPIEAEAKAKQACQASVHSSYCGPVAARCEAERR